MPKRRQLKPQSLFDEPALREWLIKIGAKEQHVRKMWKNSETFQEGNNNSPIDGIPNIVYDLFPRDFKHCTSRVVSYQTCDHGGKLLIDLQGGMHQIETVIIQHKTRYTVCVSSQVGCRMGCTFCATGTMGLVANLTAGEIVEQVWHAKQRCPNLTNVVLMGMGEPLDNYQVVKDAIVSLQHAPFYIPLGRITLSTVGVVSKIRQLTVDCPGVQLAVSLHAPNDAIRHKIVPTAKQHKLRDIMDAVYFYQDQAQSLKRKSVMMEYIMIAGINDSPECAHELGQLLQGREFIVNLIPYNPTVAGDRYTYESPSDETMMQFQSILYNYSTSAAKPLRCTIRWSSRRGQSLDAACGQLVLQTKEQQASESQDMEDYGTATKKAPKVLSKRTVPDEPDDMFTVSFIAPILLSGLMAVGITLFLFQRSSRRK